MIPLPNSESVGCPQEIQDATTLPFPFLQASLLLSHCPSDPKANSSLMYLKSVADHLPGKQQQKSFFHFSVQTQPCPLQLSHQAGVRNPHDKNPFLTNCSVQKHFSAAASLLHSKAEVFAVQQFSDTDTSSSAENQESDPKATLSESRWGQPACITCGQLCPHPRGSLQGSGEGEH